jgi:hypothetical protein
VGSSKARRSVAPAAGGGATGSAARTVSVRSLLAPEAIQVTAEGKVSAAMCTRLRRATAASAVSKRRVVPCSVSSIHGVGVVPSQPSSRPSTRTEALPGLMSSARVAPAGRSRAVVRTRKRPGPMTQRWLRSETPSTVAVRTTPTLRLGQGARSTRAATIGCAREAASIQTGRHQRSGSGWSSAVRSTSTMAPIMGRWPGSSGRAATVSATSPATRRRSPTRP